MSRGLQMYYREATTYARTASGSFYATGMRQSLIPWPVLSAPGTYNAPVLGTRDDGTMGRSGNWETESAVIPGVSAGGRALVPIPAEYTKHPKLEDFASKDNDGYSDTESGKTLANAKNGTDATNTTTKAKTTTSRSGGGGGGYSRGGGGGGGGYSRGGGGGSYSPNIYAPNVNLSSRSPSRIMNTDKPQRANLDYLRPDFETKGSREAYRRSDF